MKAAIRKVEIRSAYNYDAVEVSRNTGLECLDESLTDQSGKEDADINTLIKRFGVTGTVPVLDRVPLQSDFVGVIDYHSAMNTLLAADDTFMELPADLRSRFNHSPHEFLNFCSNPANRDEMIKLGLVIPEKAAKPILVDVVTKQVVAPPA